MSNATPNKDITKKKKATRKEMVDAIRSQAGIVALIAVKLGWGGDRKKVYRLIKRYKLEDELEDAREALIDKAESNIVNSVGAGSIEDSRFVLRTKGRSRGWGDEIEVKHKGKILIRLGHIDDRERVRPTAGSDTPTPEST